MATQPTLDPQPGRGCARATPPPPNDRRPASSRPTVADLVAAIRAHRYRYANEAELHLGILGALHQAGLDADHEATLTAGERIDFLTANGIGIEVKVDGQARDVWRQLTRYAACPQVTALLLVTTRRRHAAGAPRAIGAIPVTVLVLRGGL